MRYLLFFALVFQSGTALAGDCAPGTWRTAAPLPVSRTEVAAASDGTSLYIAGGMAADPSTDIATIFSYNPATDQWAPIARLDAPVNHAGLVVLEGNLYVVGGYTGPDNHPTDRLTVIDLATGAIRQAAPLPTARGALAAVALDGRIHALGGTTDKSVGDHDVYDPATGAWSQAAPMRVPRNHLAATTYQGLIYAFGGRDESSFTLDAAEAYDPKSDSWTDLAPLPTGRSGIGAAISGEARIVVLGGEVGGSGGHTFGEAEAYDPVTNTWEALASLPTPRHGLGVAAAGGDIYVVAGGPQPGLTTTDVNEVLCGNG